MNNMHDDLEAKRLAALESYHILDSQHESDFDDLVKLAAMIFHVPISTITLVDAHRQWFKAAVGLAVSETARDISFCTHTIEEPEALVVENAELDKRFSVSPLVTNEPHLGFYAGVPLCTSDNLAIGTFCIMDQIPRKFSVHELNTLKILANQAMQLLELRSERLKLAETEQRWKFALEGAGDGVWDWNLKTQEVIFSKTWKEMLGYEESELSNNFETWRSLVHPDDLPGALKNLEAYFMKKGDIYRDEFRLLCKDKSWKWVLTRGTVVSWGKEGSALRMVGTHVDISQHKASEEIIWKQANFDSLTDLPNRRMFFDRLKEEIKRSSRLKRMFAVMFIDLDGFKQVNDTFGHQTGDELLQEVTKRVSAIIRQSDVMARLGGDEFTVIISGFEVITYVGTIAEKILGVLNEPFVFAEKNIHISASIGIAVYPQDGKDADFLISNADSTMYKVKAMGKNHWSFFDCISKVAE